MREVGEYVRNVLMPFVEQEQGWAMLWALFLWALR